MWEVVVFMGGRAPVGGSINFQDDPEAPLGADGPGRSAGVSGKNLRGAGRPFSSVPTPINFSPLSGTPESGLARNARATPGRKFTKPDTDPERKTTTSLPEGQGGVKRQATPKHARPDAS